MIKVIKIYFRDVVLENPGSMPRRMHGEVMEVPGSQLMEVWLDACMERLWKFLKVNWPSLRDMDPPMRARARLRRAHAWTVRAPIVYSPSARSPRLDTLLCLGLCLGLKHKESGLKSSFLATKFFDIWKVLFISLIYLFPWIWNFQC